jgi:ABC-type microcin C transport system duplicated ATPase subunit YejF
MPDTAPMLELHDVEVRFNLKRAGLFGAVPQLRAVDGVSLAVSKGQTMAIVGDSSVGHSSVGASRNR